MDLTLDRDQKVDWFQVIIDLNRCGYTTLAVAQSIGTAKSTVLGWKQGADPRFDDGLRLIELWETVTKNGRESVHKVRRYSYHA